MGVELSDATREAVNDRRGRSEALTAPGGGHAAHHLARTKMCLDPDPTLPRFRAQ